MSLGWAVLCCAVLYCAAQCCAVLFCDMLCYASMAEWAWSELGRDVTFELCSSQSDDSGCNAAVTSYISSIARLPHHYFVPAHR